MATPLTHGLVGLSAAATAFGFRGPRRLYVLAFICAALPDVDVVAFRFGIAYGDVLGHRGLSHSLLAAAAVSVLAAAIVHGRGKLGRRFLGLWLFFGLVAVGHGVLDAMTDAGLGVGFFIPVSEARYFLPFRPLVAAPIGLRRWFADGGISPWGARVVRAELLWLWLPCAIAVAGAALLRKYTRAGRVANGANGQRPHSRSPSCR